MSENQQSHHDPLEKAIRAFQGMPVCDRPPDVEVLARFGACQDDLSRLSCIPVPSKRRRLMQLIASAAAGAVFLAGALALFLWNSSPPEPVQVATTASQDRPEDAPVQPPSRSDEAEKLSVPPLSERVAESQVIVVATGLDSAPATPSEVPGDPPEVMVRWEVKRILKGDPGKKEIRTRTSPELAPSFIGNEWIVFLTPDHMAGKNQQFAASRFYVELERTVKQLIAKENKTLIVGVWELTKAGEGGKPPVGTTVEYTNDGKVKIIFKVDVEEFAMDGTYVVEDNKLTATMKTSDREEKATLTIKKLTDKELATEDEVGRVLEFKRKK